MEVMYGFGFPIKPENVCYKSQSVLNDNNWNGFYNYALDLAFINLKADDFKQDEQTMFNMLVWSICHESFHSAIYKITNEVSCRKEEEIINKICKEHVEG